MEEAEPCFNINNLEQLLICGAFTLEYFNNVCLLRHFFCQRNEDDLLKPLSRHNNIAELFHSLGVGVRN